MPMQYAAVYRAVDVTMFICFYIFLSFAQNKDCGYSLELPHRLSVHLRIASLRQF